LQTISEYLTAAEAAAILKVSKNTIIRTFENRKGVLILGNPESRFTRRYRTLRIPREVLGQYIAENRVQ
jgi:Fic family protein